MQPFFGYSPMVLITEDDPHARHSPPPLRGGYAPSYDAKSGARSATLRRANCSDQMSAKNLGLPAQVDASPIATDILRRQLSLLMHQTKSHQSSKAELLGIVLAGTLNAGYADVFVVKLSSAGNLSGVKPSAESAPTAALIEAFFFDCNRTSGLAAKSILGGILWPAVVW